MEELYSIMRDFLEVEYNQESLLCVLESLEAAYSGENEGKELIVHHTRGCIKTIQEDLKAAINRMDHCIAAAAGGK